MFQTHPQPSGTHSNPETQTMRARRNRGDGRILTSLYDVDHRTDSWVYLEEKWWQQEKTVLFSEEKGSNWRGKKIITCGVNPLGLSFENLTPSLTHGYWSACIPAHFTYISSCAFYSSPSGTLSTWLLADCASQVCHLHLGILLEGIQYRSPELMGGSLLPNRVQWKDETVNVYYSWLHSKGKN